MRAVDELRRLGYHVFAEGGDIRYRYVGAGQPDRRQVTPLLHELRSHKPDALGHLREEETDGRPPESLRAEACFGHRAARLYPFLGQQVETPHGPGRLLQVIKARCAVALDSRPETAVEVPADLVRPPQAQGEMR
jgi:hypothetical protein